MKVIYEFASTIYSEVDETSTRQDGDKTITETIKVKKPTKVFFALKTPSRSEREAAEEERVAWWSKYVEKGILPQALLLKTYANYGGILSNEQKQHYHSLQAEYLRMTQVWEELNINDKENEAKKETVSLRLVELKNEILDFEDQQAVFFDNTAEAKAQKKLVEYLVLHLSYTRADSQPNEPEKPWVPFFKGATTAEKLAYMDKLTENQDELLGLSYPMLSFIAGIYSNSGNIDKAALDNYVESLQKNVPQAVAPV